jgi:hypothetical protein
MTMPFPVALRGLGTTIGNSAPCWWARKKVKELT